LIDVIIVGSSKFLLKRVRPSANAWFLHPDHSHFKNEKDRRLRLLRIWETKTPDKYSLPSGHASRGMIICSSIIRWLWNLSTANMHNAKAMFLIFLFYSVVILWTLLVGISRICLGKHYISDVLLGWCFGCLEFVLAIWLHQQFY